MDSPNPSSSPQSPHFLDRPACLPTLSHFHSLANQTTQSTETQLAVQEQEGELKRRSTWSCGDVPNNDYNADDYDKREDDYETHNRNEPHQNDVYTTSRVEPQKPKHRNNYISYYQGQPYNNSYSRPRHQYQYQHHNDHHLQLMANQQQLSRLQEANKEARAQKLYRENICRYLQQNAPLFESQQNIEASTAELRKIIIERRNVYESSLRAGTEAVSKAYQEMKVAEAEHEVKYKQLGMYLKMNKHREENQRLAQAINRKHQELDELVARKQEVSAKLQERWVNCQEQLLRSKSTVKQLMSEKESIEHNIQKWSESRFRLRQKCLKQQRLNKDVSKQIEMVDEQIRKEAEADERIRLANLKLMENLQYQHEDLNHERLRVMHEKLHQIKLLLRNSTAILQVKEQEKGNILPCSIIQQKKTQIKLLMDKIAHHEAQMQALRQQEYQINELVQKIVDLEENKEKLKQDCGRLKSMAQVFQQQLKSIEKERDDLEADRCRIIDSIKELKDAVDKLQKLAKIKQRQGKSVERVAQPKIKAQNYKKSEQEGEGERQGRENRNAGKAQKGYSKKAEKGKEQPERSNPDCYYVNKKLKRAPFLFTVFYLIVLIFASFYQKEIRLYARRLLNSK